jgi:hypothetical protein
MLPHCGFSVTGASIQVSASRIRALPLEEAHQPKGAHFVSFFRHLWFTHRLPVLHVTRIVVIRPPPSLVYKDL